MDRELREAIRSGDRLAEIRARLRLGEDPLMVGDRVRVKTLPGAPAGVVIQLGHRDYPNAVRVHLDSPKFEQASFGRAPRPPVRKVRTGWVLRREELKFEGL